MSPGATCESDLVDGGLDYDRALVDPRYDRRVTALQEAVDPEPANLARGRPVRASMTLPDRPAEFAVDGHRLLWWGAYLAPQWIEVDLGR